VQTTDDGRRGECSTLAAVRCGFVFSHFATRTVDNTVDLYAVKPDIRPESRFLPMPSAFDAPVRGVTIQLLPCRLVRKKLEWCNYPVVKKFRKYFYLFWHNSRTCRMDRQTHRQTPHDDIGRAYTSHRAAKIVQCAVSRIRRNYFRRRPKFCCSASFRLAAFFSGGFSASDNFSANSAAGGFTRDVICNGLAIH